MYKLQAWPHEPHPYVPEVDDLIITIRRRRITTCVLTDSTELEDIVLDDAEVRNGGSRARLCEPIMMMMMAAHHQLTGGGGRDRKEYGDERSR